MNVFAGRSVGRQLRCESCKATLVTLDSDEAAESSSIVSNKVPEPPAKVRSTIVNADELFNSVNRGGLAHLTEINLTVCALAYCFFQQVNDADDKLTKFLTVDNQREAFVKNVQDILQNDPSFGCLLKVKCSRNHNIFAPLAKTFFNCCVQNLRRRLFTCESVNFIPPDDSGITCNSSQKKKLRKLTSKTNIEK